jgi:hypothetical protein
MSVADSLSWTLISCRLTHGQDSKLRYVYGQKAQTAPAKSHTPKRALTYRPPYLNALPSAASLCRRFCHILLFLLFLIRSFCLFDSHFMQPNPSTLLWAATRPRGLTSCASMPAPSMACSCDVVTLYFGSLSFVFSHEYGLQIASWSADCVMRCLSKQSNPLI